MTAPAGGTAAAAAATRCGDAAPSLPLPRCVCGSAWRVGAVWVRGVALWQGDKGSSVRGPVACTLRSGERARSD